MSETRKYFVLSADGSKRYIDGKPDIRGGHFVYLLEGTIQAPTVDSIKIFSEIEGQKPRKFGVRGLGKSKPASAAFLTAEVRGKLGLPSKGQILHPAVANETAWREAAEALKQQAANVKLAFGEKSPNAMYFAKMLTQLANGVVVADYMKKT